MRHGLHYVLDRLEVAFSKRQAELLASDAERWALFVQPANRHRWPELVGCYDTESEACETGYRNPIGQRSSSRRFWAVNK